MLLKRGRKVKKSSEDIKREIEGGRGTQKKGEVIY